MNESFEENDIIPEDEAESGAGAIKKLRDKLKACQGERQEYLDGWQRARADFANLKKQESAYKAELANTLRAEFAEKLLPLADSFDAALLAPSIQNVDATWRKGLESMHRDLSKVLTELGIEPYTPVSGDTFDPALHVAIGGDQEGQFIDAVQRKGYRQEDKILRPAYVTLKK